MPQFTYKARNQAGQMIQAVMETENEQALRELLRSRQLTPVSVSAPKGGLSKDIKLPTSKKVPALEISVFSRQLSTLLTAGVPIVQTLDILQDQTTNARMKEIIGEVSKDVSGGTTLSDSLQKHRQFSPLYVSLIRAGEMSGGLDRVTGELAGFLEKDIALQGKIKSAMTYPVSVLCIALVITYFLLTKIVPQFASVLTELGGQLPPLTVFVMNVADLLQSKTWILVLFIIVAGFALRQMQRTDSGALAIDKFKMKIPVMGPMLKKSAIARFSRTMSLLVTAGVVVNEALGIAKNVTGLLPVSMAVANAQRTVLVGMPMSAAMNSQPEIFPRMMVSMTAIGEETGSIGSMMDKVAAFYDREVDQAVDQLTALIEPLMIIFLGVVVGTIVGAMFMPLFTIIGQLSG